MKKYYFIKQNGLRDCGAACILMILKYYGGYMSLEKLSLLLSTNNNGTSVYNMVECLKYLGFDSNAYKYNDISYIKCPCIVHIHYDIYNHYIVVFEINFKEKYLVVGDPNKKIFKIGFDDFNKNWSGVVIEAKPISLIIKEEEPKVFNFIINLIKENYLYFFITGFLSILISFLSIVVSFFLQITISSIFNYFIYSFLITLLLKSILEFIRNNVLIKFNYRIDKTISKNTFKNIIYLPYISSKNKSSGELISYFNDLFNIKYLLSYFFIALFINIPLIIIVSIILFVFFNKLFILNSIILLLYLLIYFYYHKKKYYFTEEVLKNKALLNSFIDENISSYETINNLNIKDKVVCDFNYKYYNYMKINRKLEILNNKEFLYKDYIFDISLLLLLWFINNDSNNFITIYFLTNLLNTNFKELLEFDGNFFNIIFSIKHIQEMPKEDFKEKIYVKGDITLKKLSKKFNNKIVLKKINLKISKGEKVFITGKSGSGKSTLFKIVKGYYSYDGSCLIDNYECGKYDFLNVIYVSSHEHLFTGRVIDNLSILNNNNINKDICEVLNNNDEFIYENGFNLSTGQKQRIALARSLNNFNIIIIDEGLDGVDVNMERRIIKRLFKYYNDKTFIYISHRLDNLDLFDRFIKIDDGRIILDERRNN